MDNTHSLNYHNYYDYKYALAKANKDRFAVHHNYNYADNEHGYTYVNGCSVPAGHRPQSAPLYGDPLVAVCKETQQNLQRLRKTLSQVDPCYQFGSQHWHSTNVKQEPEPELPAHRRPKWKAPETMFGSGRDMRMVDWKSPHSDDIEPDSTGPVNRLCYICTTLDEHQQHLARRGPQLKAKAKPKPRVDFIVPLPGTRNKRPEVADNKEYLYKVTVKTGTKPTAATSAKVYIRLKGKEGSMRPQQLCKKMANFTFGRGTKETFYIKTPVLGQLRSLVINHEGLEKKHSWYLEEIEVCDVVAKQIYLFTCRQWLSLYEADHCCKRELRAEAMEKFQREYLISVTTGNKTLAGTDATVTLTLYGKLGSSSKLRLSRKVKDGETLQKGATDKFNMVVDDIGPLERLRIEHDNNGRSPDWFLEKITIEESERAYLFPCGRWIPNDDEQDRIKVSLDLYPVKNIKAFFRKALSAAPKNTDKDSDTNKLGYLVTVLTGDVRGAGTDANVYLVLIGKHAKSKDIQLDDEKNNFERGMTDQFKIKAEDVGTIKKISIRHDNTSLAAGWFLDRVIIRKFFTEEEISKKMRADDQDEDEKALQRAALITGKTIKGRDIDKANMKRSKASTKGSKHKSKDKSEESEASDESDDVRDKRKHKKDEKRRNRSGSGSRSRRKSEETESDSDDGRTRKSKNKGKNGRKGKKKFTYGGIDTWVTDSDYSDSDSETERKSTKYKERLKKKPGKYDTDSDDGKRLRTRKQNKTKKGKYDTDTDSDSEHDYKKKKSPKSNKKNRKDDSDSDKHRKKSKKSKSSRKHKSDDSDSDSESESDSDSDSDSDYGNKKKKKGGKRRNLKELRRKVGHDSDSDSDKERVGARYKGKLYERWREGRMPFCDEYLFVCQRWLAKDEDDRQIQRELKPLSVTTFYKKS